MATSHKEKQIIVEVGNSEKQLWSLIHSKGLLHPDAHDFYRKVRSSYEKIIFNHYKQSEVQEVEFSLWKLHYKYIDEFRKVIKKGSGNAESSKLEMPRNDHLKQFKLFLSEAIEFYGNLIVKLRKHYRVPEEALFYKGANASTSVEPNDMLKCQFLCHRCLICMGDLARYKEQYANQGDWSVAVTHYLEAARIWPDSGNPQNQLAVLATYIGDEFLALYHCVRSLAVKEPFHDAWDNLTLLFEKNQSSNLQYLTGGALFDFSRPSQRSSFPTQAQPTEKNSNCSMDKAEHDLFTETKLWSLIVRTISLFFTKSSLDEFHIAFTSSMRELDSLLELDDTKLKANLESYQQMDSARRGPFRALQVVSVLIFVLENFIDNSEELKEKTDRQKLDLIQFALAATFNILARFVERCLKSSPLYSCSLLPAVLLFMEWLVTMFDRAETFWIEEKSRRAMSYFFRVSIDLLTQLNVDTGETNKFPEDTPLWEDYELRGFAPVASAHTSLDFSKNRELIDGFESGTELRAERIIKASKKIASRSSNSLKWIAYNEVGRKFYIAESSECHEIKESAEVDSFSPHPKRHEPNWHICEVGKEHEKHLVAENTRNTILGGKSVAVDDEEVILFRPLTRYNSAPVYDTASTNQQLSSEDQEDQGSSPDDCLRRATSLLMAQNPAQSDALGSHSEIANFRDKLLRHQESSMTETVVHPFSEGPISAGPPSLSAWVLNRSSFGPDGEKVISGVSDHGLPPIRETASSLTGLSISETRHPNICSGNESVIIHQSPAPYSFPVPSAPLLPEDAAWFSNFQSGLSNCQSKEATDRTLNYQEGSHVKHYSDWTAGAPFGPPGYGPGCLSYTDGYSLPRRMTSSEWLHWYLENHGPDLANNYARPAYLNTLGNPQNLDGCHSSRFDHLDRWGEPWFPAHHTHTGPHAMDPGHPCTVFATDEHHRRERPFPNIQIPTPYRCGAATDHLLRHEPQPLLQYLKEKEWRLQQDPTLREHTYMRN